MSPKDPKVVRTIRLLARVGLTLEEAAASPLILAGISS
jgi:hypothetical protein